MKPAPTRLDRFSERLDQLGLDGFLLTNSLNLRYFFGFTGSAASAVIAEGDATLLVDPRYLEQARTQTHDCVTRLVRRPLGDDLFELLNEQFRGARIGLESRHLSYADARTLIDATPQIGWRPVADGPEGLRMRKDPGEIQLIESAFDIMEKALEGFKGLLQDQPCVTEKDAAAYLEFQCRKAGADGMAFNTIVLSGSRSSLPHGSPGPNPILPDQPLLLDFGAQVNGYCGDLTRMLGALPGRARDVFLLVQDAQLTARDAVRPGIPFATVDEAARAVIREAGFGDFFGHGTGHGIGLEIHEAPLISWSGEGEIEEGMVFTIEPGIYLPGEFGIRIEDVVVVTERGCRVISKQI